MASYHIPAVEPFNFRKPEEWTQWIRRFERFRAASGLSTKAEHTQVNTLVYSMGTKAEDIFQSFNLSEEEAKVYETVKAKFESHFIKRRNTIFERAKFNRRVQQESESVDDFIIDVYSLAEHCQYGQLHDEMVRDRIVVGIRDGKLSEKLQMDSELTLEKAISMARNSESVKQQQTTMVRNDPLLIEPQIEQIKESNYKPDKLVRATYQSKQPRAAGVNSCTRCGKTPSHGKVNCPAKAAVCHKCKKKGHFKAFCRSKGSVNQLSANSQEEEDVFLGTIDTVTDSSSPWTTNILVNGESVQFKVDTGADVTVVPEQCYSVRRDGPLFLASKTLSGPAQHTLQVQGQFVATLQRGNKTTTQNVYVVQDLNRALLGLPAIEALQVVSFIEPIQASDIFKLFPNLFTGLGKLKDSYQIKLKGDAKPYTLPVPRRVAIPLLPKVEAELQRMEALGVISKIAEPTEWCAPMVVVPKPNGTVRICVDLTKLNESVHRERLLLPSVEQTLAQISGAKYFSKLDANSGFWQIQLAPESSKLTTFITPFGRFAFNRLPFGITSAPEYFQCKMSEILTGLEGVVCLIDDVLVYGNTEQQHDQHLKAVLSKISDAGLTLSKDKCVFGVTKISFLGQSVDSAGIRPDPRKVQAVRDMKPPSNVTELRRFLGMINQLRKFSPHLADKTQPLRVLLSSKNHWAWGIDQDHAFNRLKESLASTEVLALYDPNLDTIVSADASAYGLGAVLRQKQPNGDLRPVAYISRALNSTELKYAQIEKEALAATWACERFQDYLLGKSFKLETDHKPLVPLLSTKSLDEMPIRIQRFRLRLMRFSYSIYHVPGKQICTADTLSRAPVAQPDQTDEELQTEVTTFVNTVIKNLPATAEKLQEIRSFQEEDPVCQKLKTFCQAGWPHSKNLTGPLKQFLPCKSELTINNGILLKGNRLVIPPALRPEIIEKLHSGHQGFTKCQRCAKESVWWPQIRKDIDNKISTCVVCSRNRSQQTEPLMPTSLPDRPWQKVGTDIFEWQKSSYLIVIDYYSRYIEVAKLTATTSNAVVQHLKSIFSHHGIPEIVISDNGPQFSSSSFQYFSKEYSFTHLTSSPRYPQANGAAERAVKTVKSLLNKNEDPYLAMLSYRATPLENGFSPAELLMGRRIRTTVPVIPKLLKPKLPNNCQLRKKEEAIKERQRRNFNNRHRAKDLRPLERGEKIWIKDSDEQAVVTEKLPHRSYLVQTPNNTYRRNRRDLMIVPNSEDAGSSTTLTQSTEENTERANCSDNTGVRTRSGRISKPPNRLIED